MANRRTKARSTTETSEPQAIVNGGRRKLRWFGVRYASVRGRIRDFLARRPHRSFRRTRRRDYVRSLRLPGYLIFTKDVGALLLSRRWLFLCLVAFYATIIAILGGVTNQQAYSKIGELLQGSAGDIIKGSWGKAGEAGLLLLSAFGGGSGTATVDQQIYLSLALLFVWLATVWLLREVMAGRRPRMRDGLYNSAAPFLSTFAVILVALAQLIPLGIGAAAVVGLANVGLVSEGFGAMLAYVFMATVAALTLYWLTSTFIAGVIVTLPGMYPGQALGAAGDLVIGRRMRICLRMIWMFLVMAATWAIVAIPMVLLDTWLKGLWKPFGVVPLMPIVVALLSSASVVWSASYVYLLYRKIVDDDANPA